MNATVDIYNQEQITAALGQIKTALDSLISAGIPVDLTGYVRTDHTGDIDIDGQMDVSGFVNCAGGLLDGDVNVGNDLIVDGDISGGDLEVATALIGESTMPTGALLAVGGGIAVSNGAGAPKLRLDENGAIIIQRATASISGGSIAATSTRMVIDTEISATSDDLDTITGGKDGQLLILSIADSSRAVTITNTNIAGGIRLNGSTSRLLDNWNYNVVLFYDGTIGRWIEFGKLS